MSTKSDEKTAPMISFNDLRMYDSKLKKWAIDKFSGGGKSDLFVFNITAILDSKEMAFTKVTADISYTVLKSKLNSGLICIPKLTVNGDPGIVSELYLDTYMVLPNNKGISFSGFISGYSINLLYYSDGKFDSNITPDNNITSIEIHRNDSKEWVSDTNFTSIQIALNNGNQLKLTLLADDGRYITNQFMYDGKSITWYTINTEYLLSITQDSSDKVGINPIPWSGGGSTKPEVFKFKYEWNDKEQSYSYVASEYPSLEELASKYLENPCIDIRLIIEMWGDNSTLIPVYISTHQLEYLGKGGSINTSKSSPDGFEMTFITPSSKLKLEYTDSTPIPTLYDNGGK